MPLIKEGEFIPDDWQRIDAETADALPAGPAKLLLPWALLQERGESLSGGDYELGVLLPNNVDPDLLPPWLSRLALISIAFPKSADGRGFSIATRLRRLGFTGELRAAGYLIADQYALARSCGFDTVEIPGDLAERQPQEHWAAAQKAMSLAYQRGYGQIQNIVSARWADRS